MELLINIHCFSWTFTSSSSSAVSACPTWWLPTCASGSVPWSRNVTRRSQWGGPRADMGSQRTTWFSVITWCFSVSVCPFIIIIYTVYEICNNAVTHKTYVLLSRIVCPLTCLTITLTEGYNSLRRKFGPDSFWVNGPYHAIMTAITPKDYSGGSPFATLFNPLTDSIGFGSGGVDGPNTPAPPQKLIGEPVAQALREQQQQQPLMMGTQSPFDNLVGVLGTGGSNLDPSGGIPMQGPPVGSMPYYTPTGK